MSYKLVEELQPVRGYQSGQIPAAEDMWAGDPVSDVLSLANHVGLMLVITNYAGATGTAKITVESCDDTVPTNTTLILFRYRVITGDTPGAWTATTVAADGFTTTAGANQAYQIAVLAEGLDGTDKFVRFLMTEVANNPVDGAAQVFAFGPRYTFDGGFDLTS